MQVLLAPSRGHRGNTEAVTTVVPQGGYGGAPGGMGGLVRKDVRSLVE